MITRAIGGIVDLCGRHKWKTIVLGALLMLGSAAFDVARFSITTDVEALISQRLPWHERQIQFKDAFPQEGVTVVVYGPTAENSEIATNELAARLRQNPTLFRSVVQPDSGDYFERNGLLFSSASEIRSRLAGLTRARPLLSSLASDPSLRGVMTMLSRLSGLVQSGGLKLDQLAWPLSLAENTLNDIFQGKRAAFSWQALLEGHPLPADRLRRFIQVSPALDFSALEPGQKATQAIRRAAADLGLKDRFGVTVELTGQVPMNDEQFSVIRQSAVRDTLAALLGVLVVLWLALRSWKLIAAVFFSLMVGLAATGAMGLLLVGSFNLISIAFFVLFVGLGVDFGIQFSVRYRTERHETGSLIEALRSAARKTGNPLALAALATAVGFFAFLPTNYRGLSELGLIAGCGMLIAFLCSITLVPAMLAVLRPPGEPAPVGFKGLGPLDDLLQRHRIAVIAGTIAVVLAGSPLLLHLDFDFNPIDLQNPNSPSVLAYRRLQAEPEAGIDDAEILTGSLAEADKLASRLAKLPEVSRTLTLSNLIPDNQGEKIAIVRGASSTLSDALNPPHELPGPDDQENIAAIRSAADALAGMAANTAGPGADAARRVSTLLRRLASADAKTRKTAETAVVQPLIHDLDRLRKSLAPEPVALKTLPAGIVGNWLLRGGRARVQVVPKGDASNPGVLRRFATAVLRVTPSATGPAISYYESGKTVTSAFVEAAILALVAITILLFIALRRVGDVLLTLVPLLVAGAVTLEISVLWGPPLNFANIIALPLLLGVGVAFKIYYVMAWRAGKTHLLQSTLTRAVVFSAMTNAVAFGSMWASRYPGMSSMGKMMALALVCTMAAAVLFQPVLMGKPRQVKANSDPVSPPPAPKAAGYTE